MYQIGKNRTLKVCDAEDNFRKVISSAKVFCFDMSEVQRLREQLMRLIQNLHYVHQAYLKDKASREAANEGETKNESMLFLTDENALSQAHESRNATDGGGKASDSQHLPGVEDQDMLEELYTEEGIGFLATQHQWSLEVSKLSRSGSDCDPALHGELKRLILGNLMAERSETACAIDNLIAAETARDMQTESQASNTARSVPDSPESSISFDDLLSKYSKLLQENEG